MGTYTDLWPLQLHRSFIAAYEDNTSLAANPLWRNIHVPTVAPSTDRRTTPLSMDSKRERRRDRRESMVPCIDHAIQHTESPDPLLEAADPFGVSYLYPYQRLVISNVLDTEPDAVARQIVVLPTGAGKTLCFQLPAVLLPGLTVVIYPLLSLMADQLRRAASSGLPAAVLGGGQGEADRARIWKSIADGEVRIILTNPETLGQERVLRRLTEVEVSHLVIDEAHCVSEWGETFRGAYLELGRVIRELAPATTTAFTATASPPVLEAVRRHLFGDDGAHLIQAVPDRPNIAYSVLRTPAKEFALGSLLAGGAGEAGTATGASNASGSLKLPALVFCRSRKRVETVARNLAATLGWDRVAAYHAGMSKEERTEIEQWFFSANDAVLVATCAYGMGVDKSDIRTTIHYDLPGSVEAFLQESGRAGRDTAPAESVVLFGDEDVAHLPLIADAGRRRRYEQLIAYCGISSCRRVFLMELLGAECDACFGCDNCRASSQARVSPAGDTAVPVPGIVHLLAHASATVDAATAAIRTFLRKNPRLLTGEQLSRVLRGCPEPGDRWIVRRLPGPVRRRGDEARLPLEAWSHAELVELIEGLKSEGLIRRVRRGPWRGRLMLNRIASTRHTTVVPPILTSNDGGSAVL